MTVVLVLGANGLLGSSLVRTLRTEGQTVISQARGEGADVRAELTSAGDVLTMVRESRPDVIVNLAALTNVDECERTPQQAYLANVRVVENIARGIAAADRAIHLVHISTDQIYDGEGPHGEDEVTITNYYGFSKYASELAAAVVPSTVLRTNFFGRSQRPGRASLSDWIVACLRDDAPITVFDDVLFSPLSMTSLVQLIARVMEQRPAGVYNAGSRDGMSKADFAFALAAALGLPTNAMKRGTSDQAKLAAYRPKDMRMNLSRLEAAMDMRMPSLADEILSLKSAYSQ